MRIIIYLFCVCVTTISSHAALTLTLNSVDKTFALTGSDSGTPNEGGLRVFQFRGIELGETGATSVPYNNSIAFSTSDGTPDPNGWDTLLVGNDSLGGHIALYLKVTSNQSQTITGSGVFQSYAALGEGDQNRLESLNGQTMTFNNTFGSGLSDLSVTVVPEAHHYSIIGGLLCIGLGIWRKNRKSTAPVIG